MRACADQRSDQCQRRLERRRDERRRNGMGKLLKALDRRWRVRIHLNDAGSCGRKLVGIDPGAQWHDVEAERKSADLRSGEIRGVTLDAAQIQLNRGLARAGSPAL